MTVPVTELTGAALAAQVDRTLMPGLYGADGALSVSGLLAVWSLTSLVVALAVLAWLRLRPALRPEATGMLCLALFWPLPAVCLLVALPVLLIKIAIDILDRASPFWLPLLEALCLSLAWACGRVRARLDRTDPEAGYRAGIAFRQSSVEEDLRRAPSRARGR